MFCRLLRYDIRKGLISDYKKLLIVVAISVAFCIQFRWEYTSHFSSLSEASFGDIIFFAFSGMSEYTFSPDQPFLFPALWVLLLVLPMFFVLYYPFYDLLGFGKNVLIQVGRRRTWWLSKCAWTAVYIMTYFLIIYAVTAVFCIVMRIPLSTQISGETHEMVAMKGYNPMLNGEGHLVEFMGRMDLQLFVLPVISMVALALFQMMLSLIVSPIYSFIISVGILISSAYYMNPFLIGNHCMTQRSNLVVSNGMDIKNGVLLSLCMAVFSMVLGMIAFNRTDVLSQPLRDE